jgi:hypothetical protein
VLERKHTKRNQRVAADASLMEWTLTPLHGVLSVQRMFLLLEIRVYTHLQFVRWRTDPACANRKNPACAETRCKSHPPKKHMVCIAANPVDFGLCHRFSCLMVGG